MMTLEEKNQLAFNSADYCDYSVLVSELMDVMAFTPDWRMKSLVGYHLMRKYLDDDTFAPTKNLEMENVETLFSKEYWDLPTCAMFPASQVDVYFDGLGLPYNRFSYGYLINLCSFMEDEPVIGCRYVCESVLYEIQIIKGLVSYDDEEVKQRYPGWELFKIDRSLTDDMTAIFVIGFANVHLIEIAHLDPEDNCLHRILRTN